MGTKENKAVVQRFWDELDQWVGVERQLHDGGRLIDRGRFLRVVYVPDQVGDGVFVVTAYPLAGRQLKAFRRRKRRRGR